MHVEGGVGLWLDEPQSDRFNPSAYFAVRPGVSFGPGVVELQWSYAAILAPAGKDFTRTGSAHFLTTGLRLHPLVKRYEPEDTLSGLWLDGNIGYVRTEDLDRLGFDAGIGFDFQVASVLGLGPFVRYVHIVQSNDIAGADPNDAQLLVAGLNFSFGPAHRERPVDDVREPMSTRSTPCPECIQEEIICEPPACSDYDQDSVCDDDDRCPVQAGPASSWGCPIDPCGGEPLSVVVQFEFDSAGMPVLQTSGPQTMDPVLDAVAAAIAQDPTCRVCIIGHASADGAAAHNQNLSVERANAVQDYIESRGIPESRIPAVGMGEMCPLVPADSSQMNRRVEFRRLESGESCPTTCLPNDDPPN